MSEFIAPTDLPDGSRAWVAPEVIDFTRRLEALDPRLALVKEPDGAWSIYRVPEDGSKARHIMRSKPGAKLDPHIVERLRQRDTRSGHDPVAEVIRHNDLAEKHRIDEAVEAKMIVLDKVLSKAWKGRVPDTEEGFGAML